VLRSTAFYVSVEKYTYDKPVDLLRPDAKNIPDAYVCTNWINQRWQNIAENWTIESNSRILRY